MSDQFAQLKRKYVASFEQKQREIEKAWDNKDIPHLRHLTHKLAGSSGSYGFEELSFFCQKVTSLMNEQIKKPNHREIEKHLNKIYLILLS